MSKTFSLGQKAFIVRNSKVLVIKRSLAVAKGGFWDIPGGRLEWGEDLASGLAREVLEETGLRLKKVIAPISLSTFTNSAKPDNQIIRIIYFCTASGKIKLSHEHTEFRWVNIDEYKKLTFLDSEYLALLKNYSKLAQIKTSFLRTYPKMLS
jgi:8-oxo-dGTP diphosphatase